MLWTTLARRSTVYQGKEKLLVLVLFILFFIFLLQGSDEA